MVEEYKFGFIGGLIPPPAPLTQRRRGPAGVTVTATDVNFPWPIIIFLKVLGILKPFFQEGLKRGSGAEPLVPHTAKLQFTDQPSSYTPPRVSR